MSIRTAIALALTACGTGAAAGDLPPPVTDDMYIDVARDEAKLGQLLFYDPVLSGNRNISCATCHHPRFGTSDGLPLGIGEGGTGLGPERTVDAANAPEERVPRNAPALFNLGAHEFTRLFADGRVEVDASRPSGMRTPMEDEMLAGFSGLLSAQTMFPVLSQDEMAGHYSENDVAQAARQGFITGPGGAWDRLAQRVSDIDAYRQRFEAVYPDIAAGRPVDFTDISNAIAAFMAWEWRSDDSPFDAHLRGDASLTGAALRGMELFYGDAGCGACHSGPFLTDHDFHAMGVPQIGPGKAARFETHQRDVGRMRVTGREEDAYRFRTPSLRNVADTAPYGHTGAFSDLAAFVAHHADPAGTTFNLRAVGLPPGIGDGADFELWSDPGERAAILAAVTTAPVKLSETDVADLVAFLETLSDPVALEGRLGVPDEVPSGLPVDR
ncbi:cytochrome-c peroxidase [Tranquillimonas alkanivorans]|uniref:Cytochrome c peroxidase n=1 Tax=Tranquillimonas alkanivorans TaxID=441119 RepID=A0A1I5KIE6_9RHOB|nr:cytochrome c peroxidase [Tranquillimonas alkanivorans]SFO84436.1 cytochrome c peroxidase [Tranquillimonas alkanivorans]